MGTSGHGGKSDTEHGRDALRDELSRLDAPPDDSVGSQPVHVYRSPKASHHAGMVGAIVGVCGDLFKGGAGHAGPIIARLVILVALVVGLGYGGYTLLKGLDKSGQARRKVMAELETYRKPVLDAANRIVDKAKLAVFMDTVSWDVAPVITEAPTKVTFSAYRETDRLNNLVRTGVTASGEINLQSRSCRVSVTSEGSLVDQVLFDLPPPPK